MSPELAGASHSVPTYRTCSGLWRTEVLVTEMGVAPGIPKSNLSSHLPVNKGCFVHGCVLFVNEELAVRKLFLGAGG